MGYDIYDGLKFSSEEDKMKLDIMIKKKFKEFFKGETHENYKSYKFHLWKQDTSEIYRCSAITCKKLQFWTVPR